MKESCLRRNKTEYVATMSLTPYFPVGYRWNRKTIRNIIGYAAELKSGNKYSVKLRVQVGTQFFWKGESPVVFTQYAMWGIVRIERSNNRSYAKSI